MSSGVLTNPRWERLDVTTTNVTVAVCGRVQNTAPVLLNWRPGQKAVINGMSMVTIGQAVPEIYFGRVYIQNI